MIKSLAFMNLAFMVEIVGIIFSLGLLLGVTLWGLTKIDYFRKLN